MVALRWVRATTRAARGSSAEKESGHLRRIFGVDKESEKATGVWEAGVQRRASGGVG